MKRLILLTAALLVAGAASGQAGGPILTFDEALRVARDRNPSYLRAVNGIENAQLTAVQRRGALLPSVGSSLSFNGANSKVFTAVNDFGEPIEGSVESTSSSAGQGLSARMDVFNWANIARWRAARAETEAAQAAASQEGAQLRTRVGQAYWEAVRAQQRIDLEERRLEVAQAQLAAVRDLLRVAARQPTDVLGAEVDVAQQEQAVAQARGEARKAMLALRQEMGVEEDMTWTLATDFTPIFDPSTLDGATLVAEAQRSAPQVRQAGARVEAADAGIAAARSARYPTISVSGSFSRGLQARDYDALFELNPRNRSLSFQINASLPLFTGFQTSAQVGQAQVQADNAREDLRAARLQVERDVLSALIDLENAQRGVELAERANGLAQQRLELGQEQYRLNSISFTELQTMIQQAAQAERNLLDARFNFAVAVLTLEEKTGRELGG